MGVGERLVGRSALLAGTSYGPELRFALVLARAGGSRAALRTPARGHMRRRRACSHYAGWMRSKAGSASEAAHAALGWARHCRANAATSEKRK